MTVQPGEEFVLGEFTVLLVDASIYEQRYGTAECSFATLKFAGGETIKVKPTFQVSLEGVNVVRSEEDGAIVLSAAGGGTLTFRDENSRVLLEGTWKGKEEDVSIVVRHHILSDLAGTARFEGVGKNQFAGRTVSGTLSLKNTGVDSSGLAIIQLTGKGSMA